MGPLGHAKSIQWQHPLGSQSISSPNGQSGPRNANNLARNGKGNWRVSRPLAGLRPGSNQRKRVQHFCAFNIGCGVGARKIGLFFLCLNPGPPFRTRAGPNFYSDENGACKKGHEKKIGLAFGGLFVGRFSNTFELGRVSISFENCPHSRPIQPKARPRPQQRLGFKSKI